MDEDNPLIRDRHAKLTAIRAGGIDPYPYRYEVTHSCAAILSAYGGLGVEGRAAETVSVAGRVVLMRAMGKATFAHIQDGSGRLQLYFRVNDVGEERYEFLKRLDLGDIVGAQGTVFRTRAGEITLAVRAYTLLSKSVRPLPEKFHGLHDKELRYRHRYLDLIVNPEVREIFRKRATIIRTVRRLLEEHGFLEVETPTLQPVYGGAFARPFVTHHNTLDLDLYLRISNELYLKRLLVGGFERVYEFVKDFRNEGIDRTHSPEFTQVEFYCAYGDYHDAMRLVETIWSEAARAVCGSTTVTYQGTELRLAPPWPRLTVVEAIKAHTGLDVGAMEARDLEAFCRQNGIEIEGHPPKGLLIDAILEKKCHPHLIQPTFVLDFPIETTPLCKPLRSGAGDFVERFEAFACGWELANAYSELNDPVLQRRLLEEQAARRQAGDAEAPPMDEDFVQAIEYGMPPACGVGIGIDRMVMLLTDSYSIRDVILFPLLRREEGG